MPMEGLEPSTLAGPDPKSGAYANSATLATGGRHNFVGQFDASTPAAPQQPGCFLRN